MVLQSVEINRTSANCGSGLPACGPEMRRSDRRLEARYHNIGKSLIGAPEFLPDVSPKRRPSEKPVTSYTALGR